MKSTKGYFFLKDIKEGIIVSIDNDTKSPNTTSLHFTEEVAPYSKNLYIEVKQVAKNNYTIAYEATLNSTPDQISQDESKKIPGEILNGTIALIVNDFF